VNQGSISLVPNASDDQVAAAMTTRYEEVMAEASRGNNPTAVEGTSSELSKMIAVFQGKGLVSFFRSHSDILNPT